MGREARARRDRLLEAQQETEREAKQEATASADEGGRGLAIATVSSVPGMQRKVILSGGRLQGCGGSPMDGDQRPESGRASGYRLNPSPGPGLALTLARALT